MRCKLRCVMAPLQTLLREAHRLIQNTGGNENASESKRCSPPRASRIPLAINDDLGLIQTGIFWCPRLLIRPLTHRDQGEQITPNTSGQYARNRKCHFTIAIALYSMLCCR
jgi:hypothetical protein